MQRKRLEEALDAGKLMSLGFSLVHTKPDRLSQLYYVRCSNNDVVYANGEIKKQLDTSRSKSEQIRRSGSSNSNRSTDLTSTSSSSSYLARGSAKRPTKVNGIIEMDEKIEVLSLQFNQDLNLLATGDSDGRIQLYDIFSGSPVQPIRDDVLPGSNSVFSKGSKYSMSATHNMPIICMKWHPDSNSTSNLLYYAHVNGYIGVLERETMKKQIVIEEKDEIACIDFNIDGTCMASVGKDFTLRLYDSNLSANTYSQIIKSYGNHNLDTHSQHLLEQTSATSLYHTSRLQCVKFSNMSNDVLFSGGWDRTVKIWDKRTPHGLVNTINGPFICGSDAIDICNYLVLTASWVKQNSLQLWDIRNCTRKLAQLPVYTDLNSTEFKTYDAIDPDIATGVGESGNSKKGEYLYACKFFASNNQHQAFSVKDSLRNTRIKLTKPDSYSTVIACGSGSQAVHLIDYEEADENKHITAIKCQAPLYCIDTMYSCSLIACGSMKRFITLMTSTERTSSAQSGHSQRSSSSSSSY